jgi:hypothetical protein
MELTQTLHKMWENMAAILDTTAIVASWMPAVRVAGVGLLQVPRSE